MIIIDIDENQDILETNQIEYTLYITPHSYN